MTIYYSVDQVNDSEVDPERGTYGRGEESVQGFGGKARSKMAT
jgi:hypothetical protein